MNPIDNYINIKLFFISTFLILINILFVESLEVLAIISILEFIFLLFILIFRGVKFFLLSLLVITSSSFDVVDFTNSSSEFLYSITKLPVLGFMGFFILLLFAIILFFKKQIHFISKKINTSAIFNNNKINFNLKLILNFSLYVIFSGLIIGFICFLVNDNTIPINSFLKFFQKDFADYFSICLLAILIILQISTDFDFFILLKQYLFTIIISLIFSAILSFSLGFNGRYALDTHILLMPLTYFFCITVLLFLFDENFNKHKYLLIFSTLITIFLQFKISNALSGKSWLALAFVVVLIVLNKVKYINKIFASIIVLILFLGLVNLNFDNRSTENNLMDRKINEALSLFAFSQSNYYENISESPKGRVDEFLNIIEEYKQKPIFLLFGKGFGGSIKDHKQLFGSFLSAYFSDEEYLNNSFVFLHESVNVVFLKFGLIGLFFMFFIFYKIITTGFSNPWISIGFLWFFFFFGYTFSLGVFGISALILGLYEDKFKLDLENK